MGTHVGYKNKFIVTVIPVTPVGLNFGGLDFYRGQLSQYASERSDPSAYGLVVGTVTWIRHAAMIAPCQAHRSPTIPTTGTMLA